MDFTILGTESVYACISIQPNPSIRHRRSHDWTETHIVRTPFVGIAVRLLGSGRKTRLYGVGRRPSSYQYNNDDRKKTNNYSIST